MTVPSLGRNSIRPLRDERCHALHRREVRGDTGYVAVGNGLTNLPHRLLDVPKGT